MSGPCKPSNPTLAHGLFEVVQELPSTVPVGSQFGYFSCIGAITIGGPTGADPRDVAVKFIANTSQANALIADRIYTASVRLLKRESENNFTAYYTPKQPFNVGPSAESPDFTNQMTMSGLGTVVSREEITSDNDGEPLLLTAIRHTDWDSEVKKSVTFDVHYVTSKKGPLANSFGLFQLGRELHLSGVIIDWDTEKHTWVVQTGTVSVTTGHQNLKEVVNPSSHLPANGTGRKRKFVEFNTMTLVSSRKSSTSSTSTSSSASISAGCTGQLLNSLSHKVAPPTAEGIDKNSSGSRIAQSGSQTNINGPVVIEPKATAAEEGEELETQPEVPFQNTFAKKRTAKDIINDARKRNNDKY